jgi:hypothetical protein
MLSLKFGENVTGTIQDGVLTISGTGDMYDFDVIMTPYWDLYDISTVEIKDGVTSVGDAAFFNCSSLTSVTVPASVTSIGEGTFCSCEKLTDVYFAGLTTITEGTYTPRDDSGTSYWIDTFCSFDSDTVTLHYPAGDAACAAYIAQASEVHGADIEFCDITWKQDYGDATPGDINDDGKVDTNDLVRLMKKISENAQESSLDINGDGKVDTNDLIRLMKYLTDNSVEIH